MKKAKNAFAIIGIILAVVAAAVLVLHPVIENLAASLSEEGVECPIKFGDYINDIVVEGAKLLFNFEWINDFSVEALKTNFPIIILAVGGVLFIVLFILMLCKKHAKGLGWWVPMLVLFVLSVVTASVYVKVSSDYNLTSDYLIDLLIDAGIFNYSITQILGWVGLVGSLVAAASFILSSIFYMVYVCQARSKAKKVNSAREAALAKIESLLGGNK